MIKRQVNSLASFFTDENRSCELDITKAVWATDQLNTFFHQAKTILSDVDFIIETQTEILFIEYKNACLPGASHAERFKPSEDKRIQKIVRKYYDSLLYTFAMQRGLGKTKIYIYILEYPKDDSATRKYIRNQMCIRLPFRFQNNLKCPERLIDLVQVLSIDEWNACYGEYIIKRLYKMV
jgi:hypothetical protein